MILQFSNILRRLIKRLFFSGPYKLVSISETIKNNSKLQIHKSEGKINILYKEHGKVIYYKPYKIYNNESIKILKINTYERYLSKGFISEGQRVVYSLSHCGLIGPTGVIYQSRSIFTETAIEWTRKPIENAVLNAIHTPNPILLKGTTLSIVKIGAEGFYHFLHESLPKLFLVENILENFDHILVTGDKKQFVINWLEWFGIDINKLVFVGNLSHYKCDQLIFVNEVVKDMQPNIWSVSKFKEKSNINQITIKNRWIWASRSDADFRKAEWEEDILLKFPKFEKINFSKLLPLEVIKLMKETVVFAGYHGASFSNIIFCEKTLVLEIIEDSNHFFRPLFNRLSQVCSLDHLYLKFENTDDLTIKINNVINEYKLS